MEIKKYGQQYAAPENRDQFVDTEKGAVVDKKDIPPLEVIKALATRYNIEISEPRNSCKCCGRGIIGRDIKTGAPIPCNCLFRGRDAKKKFQDMQAGQAYGRWNRKQRRQMEASLRKKNKHRSHSSSIKNNLEYERKNSATELPELPEELKPVNIFESKTGGTEHPGEIKEQKIDSESSNNSISDGEK